MPTITALVQPMNSIKGLFSASLLISAFTAFSQSIVVVNPNISTVINPASKKLLGLSYDARSSGTVTSGPNVLPIGYHDPITAQFYPEVQPIWDRLPLNGVRYPGNMEIYNWNWSYTVGLPANRIAQPTGPNSTNSQTLAFGFDEFMDMVIDKELATSEVQLMVNLYPSNGQPDPAILAADWVEYCNAPNDGSNPRGGTDWAELRSENGRDEPYDIRIWNIGNEPWSSSELGGMGAATFISMATPIIDSMLVADSTIHITIPTVIITSGTSNWQNALEADQAFMDRIHGFSPHSFYDEDPNTNNPSVANALLGLGIFSSNSSKAVIMGDNAAFAPVSDSDKAVRWEGALVSGNYMLGISQFSNIELGNYWIYANSAGYWHPIRRNNNGTYTMMAAAQLFETFHEHFLDYSFDADATDQITGLPVSGVRSSGFASNDQSQASVIIINTDLILDHEVLPPSVNGLSLLEGNLVSAPTLTSDTSETTVVTTLPNGNFSLPHGSILILDYGLTVGIDAEEQTESSFLSPNPTDGLLYISPTEQGQKLTVYDAIGRIVGLYLTIGTSIDVRQLSSGAYSAVLQRKDGTVLKQQIVKK